MSSKGMKYPFGISESGIRIFNLVDLLRVRALSNPEKLAYTFLSEANSAETSLTYAQLDLKARSIAALLQDLAVAGGNVLLLYPPGLDFHAGFFGCLYAGVAAVPAYPARNNRGLPRLQAIIKDARPTVVLTTSHIYSVAKLFFSQAPDLEALRWLATDDLDKGSEAGWLQPDVSGDALAFLQYTSGSTGTPKGVMLSHQNLLHNAATVFNAVEHTTEDRYVSWLPTFHDMGFMAGVLQPLYAGLPAILMSPISFLQRPIQWLQAISQYKGTTSGAPNFAYDLCVRKTTPEQRAKINLSSWSVAFNGAEPIRAETLDRFVTAFEPSGFRREAFFPCYGLAEGTLIVSGGPKSARPTVRAFQSKALQQDQVIQAQNGQKDFQQFVGCGGVLGSQQVAIVDTESLTRCPHGQVGEIWVSGPSVAQGYWGRDEDTERTFRAFISDTCEGPFLRTGDLGFLLDGELFITGRLKDLIIIRGRNHYPQDIELSVEKSHPALRPGCGAAFSVEVAGEERLVVIQEIDDRHQPGEIDTIIKTVCQMVAEDHELQLEALALIKAGTIPKTSSGKIQRRACKQMFLTKTLAIAAEWQAGGASDTDVETLNAQGLLQTAGEIQSWLAAQIASKIRVDASEIDIDKPTAQYGIDSLTDIELVHAVQMNTGVTLPVLSFLQGFSVAELASQIQERLTASQTFSIPALISAETRSEYPLSYGQQAVWFLHQLAPESAAYNIAGAVRIRAAVNATALQRCFQSLIDRHPSLRTTFNLSEGKPVQRIHEHLKFDLRKEDASSLDEEALMNRLVEEAHRPFDLENGPVLRANLFSQSNEDHVLLLAIHHIVSDLWSLAVLLSELGALYEAETTGVRAALSPAEIRYTDYVCWQAERLAGQRRDQLWAYWQKQMAGAQTVLNLPTDRPRPPVQTYQGASELLRIGPDLTHGLKTAARNSGVTLNVVLIAALQSLLYRYTGQEDILIGCPSAGRELAQLKNVVGYFVNPLVIRGDLSANPTFDDFLAQMRRTVFEAFEHQDFPFQLLVEQLEPDRDASRSPVFQVMFALQKTPLLDEQAFGAFALGEEGARLEVGGLILESIKLKRRVVQFDLTLMAAELNNGLAASLQYNTDLFDASTAQRMLAHLEIMLNGIIVNSRQRVSSLPLLTDREARHLLFDWNDTYVSLPGDTYVHALFEARAEEDPHRTAAQFENERLSYAELNRRANQLAHYLRTLGVKPDTLVGIYMERSLNLVVALVGILKAGGAYVPIDPAYPKERIAFMLEDSRIQTLLTQQDKASELPALSFQTLCLDSDWELITREPAHNPINVVTSDNLAYVIYTSGSTGRPKGVMSTHGGLLNRLLWMQEEYNLANSDRVLQKTPYSFDVSVWEFLWPLMIGARLVLARPTGHQDPAYLVKLITEQEITTLHFVPSMLRVFLEEDGLESLTGLRRVICSGEALSFDLQEKFFRRLNADLHNLYGPTEASIDVTYYSCRDGSNHGTVPIGKPIANTQIHILDGQLQPAPLKVAGELYIGGVGLARGYVNRPDLTAERFIPDPFSNKPGARLYKTGDLARRLQDGNVEYLGRIDFQVKIRGFRIELGEIEASLNQHPAIEQATVAVKEFSAGDRRLIAYVVPHLQNAYPLHNVYAVRPGSPAQSSDDNGDTASNDMPAPYEANQVIDDLRCHLKAQLPDYMMPSAFVVLDKIPVTPNGKVDRQALPLPDRDSLAQSTAYEAPRNAVEEAVAATWAQVLELSRVGIANNFFELGGTSLIATQVISRLCKSFNLDLPLRAIFERPTVKALSERIEQLLGEQNISAALPMQRAPRDGALPLSFAQHRLWFIDQFESGSYAYNMPGALKLSGRLDVASLEASLNQIIRRHEVLRTSFAVTDGRPTQVIAEDFKLELPVADVSHLRRAEQDLYILDASDAEAKTPFDLARGPLIRARLVRTSEDSHILFVTMHHIISDGWSLNIFLKELLALYEAFSHQRPSPLRDLPIQYADFAWWQRQWLQGEALTDLLSYWKKQLGGELSALELQTDRPRSAAANLEAAKQTITITKALSDEIKSLSVREGATPFMTLLAAFNVLLHRYTGQEDLLVGTPIANRNRAEIEGLIGLFVNTLILRADLRGKPSFRALLGHVRKVAVDAYAYQDLPFEKLVEELQPDRDLTRNPLFQVMIDLQDAPMPAFEIPGLSVSTMEIGARTTKYIDLVLHVIDTADGLIASLEYSTELFDAATIGRMLDHFQTILRAVVAGPDERVCELPLLTERERLQMLVEWNDSLADYPAETCVHQVIEAAAEEAPDSIAVVFEQEQLTYRELNRRANQLAHYLRRIEVGLETLVGICMEHSIEMIVGMIGVMKAGGAYVALDPEYPQQRLASMLENARTPVLLTQDRLLARLPETEARIICADRLWQEMAREDDSNPNIAVSADNAAVVLYTSGSTGKPKGVVMTHRGTCNHIFWAQHYFPMNQSDSMTFKYSVCFDASVFEVLYPLFAKARLVIVPQTIHKDVASLVNFISRHEITAIDIPTPLLPVLMEDSNFLKCESLRQITCASDSMSVEVKENYFATIGKPLIHFYGPCEASIGSTFNLCKPGGESNIVSVGKPVANTQIYVLDKILQPVPIDITGEIYVGGVGVTRGYLNQPDVTAEKFIPDPFGKEHGARIYKTGDRGRYRPDGNLEFAGRIDHQVKIRGYRIELGDVDAAIMECPQVEEAIVIAKSLDDGRSGPARNRKLLAAYVVFKEGGQVAELRRFLAKRLPNYMIPSVFVPLADMPRSSSGKIDLLALPAPTHEAMELETDFVPPRTAVEEVLSRIWSEVLEVDSVGIHNNFFELGGHSLAAAQVIYRVRDLFRVELPLRSLFEGPTLAEMAQNLIGYETRPGRTEKIAQAYKMVKNMSQEEIQMAIHERKKGGPIEAPANY